MYATGSATTGLRPSGNPSVGEAESDCNPNSRVVQSVSLSGDNLGRKCSFLSLLDCLTAYLSSSGDFLPK